MLSWLTRSARASKAALLTVSLLAAGCEAILGPPFELADPPAPPPLSIEPAPFSPPPCATVDVTPPQMDEPDAAPPPPTCGGACLLAQTCDQNADVCLDDLAPPCGPSACAQDFCQEPGRWAVTADVAVDLAGGRKLWERHPPPATESMTDAATRCGSLKLAGVMGWRLPLVDEVGALVFDAGGLLGCPKNFCNPAVAQNVFDLVSDVYWTDSADASHPGKVAGLSFCDGRSSPYHLDPLDAHYDVCVHDPLP